MKPFSFFNHHRHVRSLILAVLFFTIFHRPLKGFVTAVPLVATGIITYLVGAVITGLGGYAHRLCHDEHAESARLLAQWGKNNEFKIPPGSTGFSLSPELARDLVRYSITREEIEKVWQHDALQAQFTQTHSVGTTPDANDSTYALLLLCKPAAARVLVLPLILLNKNVSVLFAH
jgi:hypothetical protein